MRIGHGFDVHGLAEGCDLVLGGVFIPHDRGLAGHSDGDVLLHAIASALLGALGEGDLGSHCPSREPKLRGILSRRILSQVTEKVASRGLVVSNVDSTLVAEEPRLAPHRDAIQQGVADALGVSLSQVNVKITSTDGLGAIGRGEGIAAHAVVLLVDE